MYCQVLPGSQPVIQAGLLKDYADEAPHSSPLSGHVVAADGGAAATGAQERAKDMQGCCLAGAIRSQKAESLAGCYGKGKLLYSAELAVPLCQTVDLDDVLHPSLQQGFALVRDYAILCALAPIEAKC
jgi:hypothetical protein